MSCKVIGGEFEIDPALLLSEGETQPCGGFSSGRSALKAILAHLGEQGETALLLPEYLCESVVRTAQNAGCNPSFYAVGRDLRLERGRWGWTGSERTAVLLVNYFGLLDLSKDIAWLKRAGFTVIVDHVQAYFSQGPDSEADYQFTSLRKTFPVPDGAQVLSRLPVRWEPFFGQRNQFYPDKTMGALLKHLRLALNVQDDEYLALFAKGEALLDAETDVTSASVLSAAIMSKLDLAQISQTRVRNAQRVVSRLGDNVGDFVKLNQGVPLCIPVLLKNRDEVRSRLRQKGIFLPVHWPACGACDRPGGLGRWMAEHELSLVIDQRYTLQDMDFIVDALLEAKPDFLREIDA